jgi:uncharacterized damage-inducible protein DinB
MSMLRQDGSHERITGETMSTETIKLLARYNSHANQEMGRVLAELTVEEWNEPLGGYFPTIRSLASHIFSADLAYLKRFAALRPFAYLNHPLFQRTIAKGEVLFPALSDYEPNRKELDAVFTRFAGEVTPEDLSKRLRFTNYQGVEQEKDFGGLVLHTFNHQTHHRGQVSLYLDILSKKNDFSGIAPLI